MAQLLYEIVVDRIEVFVRGHRGIFFVEGADVGEDLPVVATPISAS